MSRNIVFKIKEEKRPELELLLAKEKMTKMQFAKNININTQYLYQILNGRRHCAASTALKICNGLSVDVYDYFFVENLTVR